MSQQWRSQKPSPDEHAPFYANYIAEAGGRDLVEELDRQCIAMTTMLRETPESRGGYRYAEGKWTVREVVMHVIDAERVFGFRVLWFARNSGTDLPGFDENLWVPESRAEDRTLADLAAELAAVRKATIATIKSLPDEIMARRGTANGKSISSRALAWIIAGHASHHEKVLREKYLVQPVAVKPPAAVTPG